MTPPIKPLLGDGRFRARGSRGDRLQTASWLNDRVTLDHQWMFCGDAELAWTAPQHLIVLTEDGGTSQTHVRISGSRAYEGRDGPGVLSVVPAGADRVCAYRNVDLQFTALWIDPALQDRFRGCEGVATPPPRVNGSDAVVNAILTSLREEAVAGHCASAAYIEHVVGLILLRLAQLDGAPSAPEARSATLNKRALARVQDYIEANICSDIALSDLANLLGMPVDRFARRFRAVTGLAPYAYVIERRVRRAEMLLKTTDMEIAAIASALGFSSQSHLTTTFRRVSGTTPRVYRMQFSSEI